MFVSFSSARCLPLFVWLNCVCCMHTKIIFTHTFNKLFLSCFCYVLFLFLSWFSRFQAVYQRRYVYFPFSAIFIGRERERGKREQINKQTAVVAVAVRRNSNKLTLFSYVLRYYLISLDRCVVLNTSPLIDLCVYVRNDYRAFDLLQTFARNFAFLRLKIAIIVYSSS